ncbi:MAG TPA: hypothetical protein IAC28_09070 [Candidatus Aphodovivens excrementavium]|nr:hypothetical protein [Candidatus Aphodovivens excrementavium]
MPATLTRWLMAVLLAVSSVPFVFSGGAAYADTSEDTTAPQVTSVEIVGGNQSCDPGDTVAVQIGFVEDGTGVSDASVDFVLEDDFREGTSSGGGSAYGFVDYADSPQYTGTLTLEVTLPENAHPGAWRVSSVWLKDQRGNSTGFSLVYYDDGHFELSDSVTGSNLPAPGFSVKEVEPGRDYVSPVVKSVRIADANTAKRAGETMTVIAEVVEEGSGIVSASCGLQIKDISSSEGSSMGGTLADGYVDYEAPLKSGTFEIPVTLPENAKAGGWIIGSISFTDRSGNSVTMSYEYYEETNEYWLSDSPTTNRIPNASFDVTATAAGSDRVSPEILGVEIVSGDTVNRPGVVRVEVRFKDEESGVASVYVEATPNAYSNGMVGSLNEAYGSMEFEEPIVGEASAIVEIPIGSKAMLGGWKLTSISVRDAAGNDGYAYIYGHGDEEYYNYFEIQGEEIVAPHFTVEDEFDFAFEMALSNPRLKEAVEGISEGYAARILIDGDGVLSEGVLAAIAGKDVTLVCYKDAYQWVINGNDIVNDPKDLDLDVDIIQEPGSSYGIDEDVVRLVFYPNGQLPGPIQLRFKSDYLYTFAGLEGTLHLYYLDNGKYVEEDGDIDLVFDGTDKWCYATFTHNSEFVVSPSELTSSDGATGIKPLGTQGAGGSQLAATGDGAGIAAIAIGSIACVAGLTVWRVRRSATKR